MAIYEEIPVAGFYTGDTYQDDELKYSDVGFTQKGVTLAKEQGEILMGTLLARSDVDKKYYPYGGAGAADGLDVARGVMRHGVNLTDRDQHQNIVIAGILKLEKVHGYDAAALAQLGAVIDTVRGTFKF